MHVIRCAVSCSLGLTGYSCPCGSCYASWQMPRPCQWSYSSCKCQAIWFQLYCWTTSIHQGRQPWQTATLCYWTIPNHTSLYQWHCGDSSQTSCCEAIQHSMTHSTFDDLFQNDDYLLKLSSHPMASSLDGKCDDVCLPNRTVEIRTCRSGMKRTHLCGHKPIVEP